MPLIHANGIVSLKTQKILKIKAILIMPFYGFNIVMQDLSCLN